MHRDNVNAISLIVDKVNEDGSFDRADALYVCSLVDQWAEQVQAAADYFEEYRQLDSAKVDEEPSLSRLETDVKHKQPLIREMVAECESMNAPKSVKPSSSSAPTPNVDFTNMTEEEIEAELRKDPCYRGRGPLGHIWDIECQLRTR